MKHKKILISFFFFLKSLYFQSKIRPSGEKLFLVPEIVIMLLNIKLFYVREMMGAGGGVFSGGWWGLLMRGGWVLKIKGREQ